MGLPATAAAAPAARIERRVRWFWESDIADLRQE
jgi:hypothetical protein